MRIFSDYIPSPSESFLQKIVDNPPQQRRTIHHYFSSTSLFLDEYSTGYFMPIKYFAPINDLFTGSVSITCNLILICLVVFRSTKEMRIYSKILILNALVDLQYTISVLVTQPVRCKLCQRLRV